MGDEVLKASYEYDYHPSFLQSLIKQSFADEVKINVVECPFSVEEIETFLEMTASLPFFVIKNNLSVPKDDDVFVECELLLRKGHWSCPDMESFDLCLCSRLSFNPYTSLLPFEKGRLDMDVKMYDLSKQREEEVKERKKRFITFESSIGYYSEAQFNEMSFVPREVGYNIQEQTINLKHLRISRHVKQDQYPLFLDVPYIKDYVAYSYMK
jgi:hypothetical protein